ncbi:ribonuclease P protein component [Candidatus Saccharibacteria bacterium]|nr:ribonuclease P protein component [Candidatus Saccharibacteria bacterium]
MLSKRYRFHSRGGVRFVYQNGKTIRSPKMSLVFVDNPKGFTRFGVTISKKVEKSAVKRNFIRRRVYEALRKNIDLIPKKRDYLFVIYAKEVGKMPFSELEAALGQLVEESKVCYNTRK